MLRAIAWFGFGPWSEVARADETPSERRALEKVGLLVCETSYLLHNVAMMSEEVEERGVRGASLS